MARAGWVIAVALCVAGPGCEKREQPSAPPDTDARAEKDPDDRPPVVVEDPGQAPDPVPADPDEGGEAAPPEFGRIEVKPTQVPCSTEADCVKASCCHATSCVAPADAPDCSQVMCTADCRGGTTDCYGGCVCQAGTCAARLWWAE